MNLSEDEYLKRCRLWDRKRKTLGEDGWRELCVEVENRLSRHLLQMPRFETASKAILGGDQFFGVRSIGRIHDEPDFMESKFVIDSMVTKDGEPNCMVVVLRCWADWDCKTAIEYNRSMVARCCAEFKLSFPVRRQTEVQNRTIIMWLRLRGKFFWNKRSKVNESNLYFDSAKNVLRVIHSDDFQNWLVAHSQLSPDKADFKALIHQIDAAAMNREIADECQPCALFDRRGDVVYVSNGDSEMMRVKPAVNGEPVIEIVPNGTDSVVFPQGATLAPWSIVEGEGVDPFESCPPFSSANYQSEHGRMIARLWFLGLASCLRSYPAIVFTGKMRSGKSRTAKAIFELLGAPVRLSAIRANGESDFWTVLNKGGVVCFDNVDTKNAWFGDAMQLACTDGSTEVRTLFTNADTTVLQANAKIIMTSNNPMFASESGLADRLQIVRLNQFDGKNAKESGDSALTKSIADNRDAALTWMVRVVSRALADRDKVEVNVNLRHPDFADFAMRCARSLSAAAYEKSILALKSAEFDKALLTVQNNATMNYIFEVLSEKFAEPSGCDEWEFTAGEMMDEIVSIHPDLEKSKYLSATSIGKALGRYYDQLAVLFDMRQPRKYGSQTKYMVTGFSAMYAKNQDIFDGNEEKSATDVTDLY